ncbi:MAG: DUF2147 domain-containing protein [Acidobacteriota bacterium]|nr:DUF2147 domain-containing protein [Acidobacteriota bacterium]
MAFTAGAFDPSPAGVWQTIDDNTHKPRGLIRLYEKDGAIFGRIEASFDPKEAREVCDQCSDDRRNKPVIGLIVMRNMKRRGSEYSGGDILDPDTGTVYRCKFTIQEGGKKMVVRGYVGFSLLGRSQVWYRQE